MQTVVTRPSQESAKLVWEKIDTQHQGLFRRIDDIKRAIEAEEGEPLARLAPKFRHEVTAQFRYEEGVMARYAYPFADAHKGLHDNLIETLEEALGRPRSSASIKLFLEVTRHLTRELQHCVADDDHLRAFLTEDETKSDPLAAGSGRSGAPPPGPGFGPGGEVRRVSPGSRPSGPHLGGADRRNPHPSRGDGLT